MTNFCSKLFPHFISQLTRLVQCQPPGSEQVTRHSVDIKNPPLFITDLLKQHLGSWQVFVNVAEIDWMDLGPQTPPGPFGTSL